jgi:outer membrane protein assembly factor BamC
MSGCGWLFGDKGYFRDKGDDYLEAKIEPEMQVPEGLDDEAIEPLYVIPPTDDSQELVTEAEVPRPAPLLAGAAGDMVRIQKLGEQRWILVDLKPAQVWPRIRNFLLGNRLRIEGEDPNQGLMETAWLARKDDEKVREKYRFRIEQGVQPGSAEVHIVQVDNSLVGYQPGTGFDWPGQSLKPEREEWMVGELAGYLASVADQTSISLRAQGISTASRMALVKEDDGSLWINLKLPFDRAWASVGYALAKAEFTVHDMDRSAGSYYVSYNPDLENAEEAGFLANLFGWGEDGDDRGFTSDEQYRVEVQQIQEGVAIRLHKNNDEPFNEGESEFLLGLIKSNLS